MGFLARFASLLAVVALCAPSASAIAGATIRVGGSTNDTPALKKMVPGYESAHPGTTVSVVGSSSGEGIAALRAGTLDVACSDVAVNDPGFNDTKLGVVGFVFVVGSGAGVKNLTRPQVEGIYAGKITNWKQIGGNDLAITPFSRPIGVGTRFVFEMTVAKTVIPMKVEPDATSVVNAVAATPGGIGYSSTNYVDDAHKSLIVDYEGVTPTDKNIVDHTYKFSTDEHAYTLKSAGAEIKSFLNYAAAQTDILKSFGIIALAHEPA